jgi:hypothetical protein
MLTKKSLSESEAKVSKNSKTATTKTTECDGSKTIRCTKTNKPSGSPLAQTPIQHTDQTRHVAEKKCQKTRITVKYDTGINNQLTIRGQGANLNWDKGYPLKNVKSDEWTWETETNFSLCEFKVLLNDQQYETGENHHLTPGASIAYSPRFQPA